MTFLWWIRRDLRLTDNAALHASLKPFDQTQGKADSVIPIFILDPAFAHASTRRKDFLYEGSYALDKELRGVGVKDIHAPWVHGIKAKGYPEKPIVERDKDRTLQAYKFSKKVGSEHAEGKAHHSPA